MMRLPVRAECLPKKARRGTQTRPNRSKDQPAVSRCLADLAVGGAIEGPETFPIVYGPTGRTDTRLSPGPKSSELDLHVHARGEVELHQRVDRLGVGLHDVEQPLVGAHLELLARLLVDVRAAVHGELLDPRRHGNGATNESTRTTRGICDFTSRLVENAV